MKYLVFDYDNGVVTAVYGVTELLPEPHDDYVFKKEWVTLAAPFFGDRAVFGVGYYKLNKTEGNFKPTLFFAPITDQFDVRAEGSPRTLDRSMVIR